MTAILRNTLTFSEEQGMLLDTAAEFFRQKSPIAEVRRQLLTEEGFDAAVWREMAALGWTGLAVPEAHGGSGFGLAAAVVLAEPMGRYLSATPLLSTQLFVQGVLAGTEEVRDRYLGRIAAGAAATVALLEADGNWDLSSARAAFTVSGGDVRLSGRKTFVSDAAVAELLLISGRCEDAPALVVVEASELPQGALRRETILDETRRSYQVVLDGISVPSSRLIAGASARTALAAIRDAALLLFSAEAAGGIAGTLDLIVDYLNTRTAFGRKIGSFQALKHPSVDILIGLERSRSHVYHAASLIAAGEEPEAALRMAKAEASESFAFAGDRAVQFHGGFGFTYECDAQLFLRRALWLQYAFGDAAHHRKHLAQLLLG
ncbi:MAG: acyl-CoA/acyl-ACP dehydrogenase [Pseudomonadales bacterium]|nr:acyl-CoA/acyl-ACP dehydrogenase [Pseudomonadales bacterium]